jgi:hypothetical protein
MRCWGRAGGMLKTAVEGKVELKMEKVKSLAVSSVQRP